MQLHTPIKHLNRVGEVLAKRLKRLGIETVEDLLFYFPFRYEDLSEVSSISELKDGQQANIKGTIELIANRRSPRKRTMLTEAVVSDGVEQLRVIWFGQPFIAKTLKVGDEVYLSGKVKDDMLGVQLVSPTYEKVRKAATTHTARIVPMYHLTSGITHKQIRSLTEQAVRACEHVVDWIPDALTKKLQLLELSQALKYIHFPENKKQLQAAEARLKFDELFLLQLRAEMIRQSLQLCTAEQIVFKEKEIKAFVDSLPFTLTKHQKIAAWEILQDIEKKIPMNRMLEGDVGSGKTVVAALAFYSVVLNNKQGALLAPTEILAKQHFESLQTVFGASIRVGLLTRTECGMFNVDFSEKTKKGKRAELIKLVKGGKIDVLIGTHAILSEKINFKKLALVVVDEQHRFGVEQRKKIREQSGNNKTVPHFLSMTATPIPRSFALTLYGDLDISIIKEMPEGRKKIKTRLVEPHNRGTAYDFIRDQVQEGRQVFVICPLIEEDTRNKKQGVSDKKSVLTEYEKLSEHIFPDLNVSYLHGKMKAADKDATMKGFAAGEIDVLVSTSVVEVGVDIPNASVMMIEGAERFGLAQLHQFRGRVGRSDHQSYCFVFTDSDSHKVGERLQYFEKTTDGFALAEFDLHMRGPGEVYGTTQSGMMQMRLASMRDTELIKKARDAARGIDFEEFPSLRERVQEWEVQVHLE